MKRKMARLAGGIAGALALILLSGPGYSAGGEDTAPAGPTSTLVLDYGLYAGGIPFGHASMTARLDGDVYKASSTLETEGIVNKFWQSKIETSSNGVLDENRVQPSVYDSFATRRQGHRQEVTLKFNPDGPESLYANPPYHVDRYPVPADKKRHALDPLSAVVFLTTSYRANEKKPCGVVAPVFDGRRRYDIAFSFVKKANVDMDNGLYKGPALVCQVEYRQVAGYQQRIVAHGHKMPKIYAWVASFQSTTDPNRHYMVPLRLWADTDFGLITAVAQRIKLDGADQGKPS